MASILEQLDEIFRPQRQFTLIPEVEDLIQQMNLLLDVQKTEDFLKQFDLSGYNIEPVEASPDVCYVDVRQLTLLITGKTPPFNQCKNYYRKLAGKLLTCLLSLRLLLQEIVFGRQSDMPLLQLVWNYELYVRYSALQNEPLTHSSIQSEEILRDIMQKLTDGPAPPNISGILTALSTFIQKWAHALLRIQQNKPRSGRLADLLRNVLGDKFDCKQSDQSYSPQIIRSLNFEDARQLCELTQQYIVPTQAVCFVDAPGWLAKLADAIRNMPNADPRFSADANLTALLQQKLFFGFARQPAARPEAWAQELVLLLGGVIVFFSKDEIMAAMASLRRRMCQGDEKTLEEAISRWEAKANHVERQSQPRRFKPKELAAAGYNYLKRDFPLYAGSATPELLLDRAAALAERLQVLSGAQGATPVLGGALGIDGQTYDIKAVSSEIYQEIAQNRFDRFVKHEERLALAREKLKDENKNQDFEESNEDEDSQTSSQQLDEQKDASQQQQKSARPTSSKKSLNNSVVSDHGYVKDQNGRYYDRQEQIHDFGRIFNNQEEFIEYLVKQTEIAEQKKRDARELRAQIDNLRRRLCESDEQDLKELFEKEDLTDHEFVNVCIKARNTINKAAEAAERLAKADTNDAAALKADAQRALATMGLPLLPGDLCEKLVAQLLVVPQEPNSHHFQPDDQNSDSQQLYNLSLAIRDYLSPAARAASHQAAGALRDAIYRRLRPELLACKAAPPEQFRAIDALAAADPPAAQPAETLTERCRRRAEQLGLKDEPCAAAVLLLHLRALGLRADYAEMMAEVV